MATSEQITSQQRLDEAAADARELLKVCPVCRALVNVRMIGLRLIALADSVVAETLEHGWDVDASAVQTVLNYGTLESATSKADSASQLERDVLEVVLPSLSALAFQEQAEEDADA